MTTLPDLNEAPISPDDQAASWAPADERPVTVSATPFAVRFSLLRLGVAITLAPLPFVLFSGREVFPRQLFGIAGVAMAVAVMLIRAADLPRINVGVGAMLLTTLPVMLLIGASNYFALLAFFMTLVAIPCMFYAHAKCPYYGWGNARLGPDSPRCDRVFDTGIVIYVLLNVVAWRQFVYLLQRNHEIVWPTIVTLIVFVALVPINIALWGRRGTTATLDQRPDLGFLYEWTLVGIPLLALCLLPRSIWRWW